MLILGIVELLKGVEAFGEVCAELRRVVPLYRGIAQRELMVLVVREARDFLRLAVSNSFASARRSSSLTLGRRTGWLAPAKRPIGCTGNCTDMVYKIFVI